MNYSLPYKVYYSSGDKYCEKCHDFIRAGHLKMAIILQADDDDALYPEWYHSACFFKTVFPRTEAAFDGFANLRYVDQIAIKAHLGTLDYESESATNALKTPDFSVEYTKVDQDSCVGCKQKIEKQEIRIMSVVYDLSEGNALDNNRNSYHVVCFAQSRVQLGFLQSADCLPGFNGLSENDKEMITKQIPLMNRELHKPVQTKNRPQQTQLERTIETQNKEYYELFDNIKKFVPIQEQTLILRENWQFIPDSSIDLLHHLTDVVYYGSLYRCEICGMDGLIFANSTYACSNISTWSKCGNNVKEPKRRRTIIHPYFLEKYPFLNIRQPIRSRAIHSFRFTDENGRNLVFAPYKHPPLFNMEFVVIGSLKRSTFDIEKTIKRLGGRVVPVIYKNVAAIISTKEEIQKMGYQMKSAKDYDIQVISEDFLEEVNRTDPIHYIISKSLSDWGGNPYDRIEKRNVAITKSAEYYTSSIPEKLTFRRSKDGSVVDPESGLEEVVHVFSQEINGRELKFSVSLGLVDIELNKNSFYRMQLLKSNQENLFWIFESRGRISTVIGSKRLTKYMNPIQAINQFKSVYKEKTGNIFGCVRFVKRPGKYFQHDIDLRAPKLSPDSSTPTKLSPPVYNLMKMLFDVSKHTENMMLECDLDIKQMPLGKISSAQINSAKTVLDDIWKLILQRGTIDQLRDASNKFYTMIPHGFGVMRPTIIDSFKTLAEKREMLNSLLNMSLTYDVLDEENSKRNPLDACYCKLKAEIVPIPDNAPEFHHLCSIVENTHGPTHAFRVRILEAFRVSREGEDIRFQAHDQTINHQLLWHGSRLVNFVSILSNGLQIHSAEDGMYNGSTLGNGIYFADIVTKSANYCLTNDIGFLLLCEVALGQSLHVQADITEDEIAGIPNNKYQSVKGCGTRFLMHYTVLDGVYVASGNLTKAEVPSPLAYNEYVVYDPTQVKIKYLLKMQFSTTENQN